MNDAPGPAVLPDNWWGRTFRALRHRNYRLYFTGQLVSITGSWVQFTAQSWLAWELTHQDRWPAFISAAQVLPTFFLGLWGGSLADRFAKRALIIATQAGLLVLALLLAAVTYGGWVTEWYLLTVAGLSGLVIALDLPARLAFVNEMVGPEDLVNAVALNALVFNMARAIGPAIAAALLAIFGPAQCFLLNGLSYVAVLIALFAMRPTPWTSSGTSAGVPLVEAFNFLARRPRLVLLLFLTGAVAACGWPVLALLPALAARRLEGSHGEYGALVSAVGVGALLGSLAVAMHGSAARRGMFISGGVASAISAIAGLAMVNGFASAVFYCVLLGGGLIAYFATAQATLQLSAADHNRGRVMSVWTMVLCGAQPLGNLLTGAVAGRWGVAATLAGQSTLLAGAAVLILVLRSALGVRGRNE